MMTDERERQLRTRLWLVRDGEAYESQYRVMACLSQPVWEHGVWLDPRADSDADLWLMTDGSQRVVALFGLQPLRPGECVEVTITGARVGEVRRGEDE